jgi:hypothetical protein
MATLNGDYEQERSSTKVLDYTMASFSVSNIALFQKLTSIWLEEEQMRGNSN